VYRVTPYRNNSEGQSTIFTLEIRLALEESMVQISGLSYRDGDFVPAINLSRNLPSGAVITWTADGNSIGMATAGVGEIPAFAAINSGNVAATPTVTYTLSYLDGQGCSFTGSFTIVVLPKTVVSLLSANPVSPQVICAGGSFTPMGFTSFDASGTAKDEDVITYRVTFVSGMNILDLSGNKAASAASYSSVALWQPTPAANVYGSGMYRVTPYRNNSEGQSTDFNLEVRLALTEDMVNISGLSYREGDAVSTIDLTKSLPSGVVVNWKATGSNIGMAASGAGEIPSFTAFNAGGDV
jgi:hypothetical protein